MIRFRYGELIACVQPCFHHKQVVRAFLIKVIIRKCLQRSIIHFNRLRYYVHGKSSSLRCELLPCVAQAKVRAAAVDAMGALLMCGEKNLEVGQSTPASC